VKCKAQTHVVVFYPLTPDPRHSPLTYGATKIDAKKSREEINEARSKMKPNLLSPLHAHQANFDRKWILLDFEKVK
jgi:hypothetical protein